MTVLGFSSLQVAVVEALRSNSAIVSSAIGGIYDGTAANDSRFPYIVIDGWDETPRDGLNHRRSSVSFLVHVFSDQKSNKQVAAISNLIAGTLNRATLQLSGWSLAHIVADRAEVIIETNDVRHCWIRFYANIGAQ